MLSPIRNRQGLSGDPSADLPRASRAASVPKIPKVSRISVEMPRGQSRTGVCHSLRPLS